MGAPSASQHPVCPVACTEEEVEGGGQVWVHAPSESPWARWEGTAALPTTIVFALPGPPGGRWHSVVVAPKLAPLSPAALAGAAATKKPTIKGKSLIIRSRLMSPS